MVLHNHVNLVKGITKLNPHNFFSITTTKMSVFTGNVYIIPEVDILNLPILPRVLDWIYGKGNAQWELVDPMIQIKTNTELTGLREKLEYFGLILPQEQ
jgi:hypothetical protein